MQLCLLAGAPAATSWQRVMLRAKPSLPFPRLGAGRVALSLPVLAPLRETLLSLCHAGLRNAEFAPYETNPTPGFPHPCGPSSDPASPAAPGLECEVVKKWLCPCQILTSPTRSQRPACCCGLGRRSRPGPVSSKKLLAALPRQFVFWAGAVCFQPARASCLHRATHPRPVLPIALAVQASLNTAALASRRLACAEAAFE